MKTSLHALVSQSSAIEEMIIDAGGELTPEIEEALAIVDMHLPAKVDSYKMTMDRFEMISSFYQQKAEEFLRIAKGADKIVSRCHENLMSAMVTLKLTELSGNDYSFKLVNNPPSVAIEDEDQIPDAYQVIKQVKTIDKKRVGEDLKMGVPVPGASLKQGQRIKAGINKAGK